MPKVEFFFDVSSPWTYLAFHNIQPLPAELGFEIDWRPVLVGGIFNKVNPTMYEMRANPIPVKQAYMHKDLQDWARSAGLRIVFPPRVFPVNSVKAMRGCLAAAERGRLLPYATALFELYWSEDRDISQDDVLAEACARAGLDGAALAARIAEPAIKERLKANTDEAMARGAFGSPTMFLGDDMYFGNDRLPLLREAVLRLRAAA